MLLPFFYFFLISAHLSLVEIENNGAISYSSSEKGCFRLMGIFFCLPVFLLADLHVHLQYRHFQ